MEESGGYVYRIRVWDWKDEAMNSSVTYDQFETGLLFLLLDPLWEVVLVRNHWFTGFSLIVLKKKLNKPQCINNKSLYKNRKTTTCKKLQTARNLPGVEQKVRQMFIQLMFFLNLALHQSKRETNDNF